ncbi:MAG: tripartite tricarboxylate transporter substrate binding protein [Rhizobiales bacterium]|nr:tripartite tricarboxylate transporter substrate binding protein [Hyphomicrobiales bacterium]
MAKSDRRSFLKQFGQIGMGVMAYQIASFAPQTVLADEPFKGRTLKLVVPFPPGGATDVIGRIVMDRLGQMWNNTIVVENRPGAGGNIGVDTVARSEPNGETLLIVSVGMATNRYLYSKVNYDPVADFIPVSLVAMVPNVLVVGNHLPIKSVAELIDYAKKNPGKLNYGSSGVGTSVHLSGELFQKMTGTVMTHVPYRGTAQATQDLIGGRIDLMFDNISQILPHIRSGSVRALGITTAKRSPVTPEFVPVAETVPGFDVSSWFALYLPAKTPANLATRYEADVAAAVKDASVKQRLEATGAIVIGSSSQELSSFLVSEMKVWGDLIKSASIKAD